jgi:hypothetical protein
MPRPLGSCSANMDQSPGKYQRIQGHTDHLPIPELTGEVEYHMPPRILVTGGLKSSNHLVYASLEVGHRPNRGVPDCLARSG